MSMYNLYFFEIYDHHQSGFVTYMNELIVGLQQQRDAKLNVVILASPTSKLVLKEANGIKEYSIPSIKNQSCEKIACILKRFVVESEKTVFFINYAPSYPTVKMLREYFPYGKIVNVIHDFMWATYLLGDVERFQRILLHQECCKYTKIIEDIYKDGYLSNLSVDKVVCLSEDALQILKDIYKIPKEKIILIYNGLNDEANVARFSCELRQKMGILPHEKILVYVGRVTYQKGIINVLECYNFILRKVPECLLVIIGQIDDNIQASITERFNHRVLMTGELPKQKVYEWYNIADVGLLPSYYEQCSYTGIEMKMYGLPVVASDGLGVRNMFDVNNGIIANIENRNCPKEFQVNLGNAIVKALTLSSSKIKKIRKKAREHYLKQYEATIMTEKYVSLLKSFSSMKTSKYT